MKKEILVITSTVDDTVDYIIKKYGEKACFCRFDVDRFSDYTININNFGCAISCDKWEINLSDIVSIYYRKPMLPDFSEFRPEYHVMLAKDIITVVNGIVDSFIGKVLTKPNILRRTENKVFQLMYAVQNHIPIPASYIGNSQGHIRDLGSNNLIIKPISIGKLVVGDKVALYRTNNFQATDEDISLMPLYIQEYVKKCFEVRLTCINGEMFSVRIDAKNKLDWRKDYKGNSYAIIDPPVFVVEFCKKMLKDFGLMFGAFDFIVDQNGDWIFLEINPNGQWLWLEKILGLPISKKIVDYLVCEE